MLVFVEKESNIEIAFYEDEAFHTLPQSGEELRFRNHYGDWVKGIVDYIRFLTAKDIKKIYIEDIIPLETET